MKHEPIFRSGNLAPELEAAIEKIVRKAIRQELGAVAEAGDFLGTKEVMTELGISRSTLERLKSRREIRWTKFGGKVMFCRDDVEAKKKEIKGRMNDRAR